ncbi:tyrosine-type recombinase/integrase [Aquabacterium sp.]|uniref:tyrosine-type recombinase/integrase n=1 Tax=Aquabacterium sp. TaxID=1872578 RepID=UPI003D6CC3C4
MAKPLGLTKRGGSYQLRIVIPKDLRHCYGARTDFRISLSSDKALAQPLAHRLRAEREDEFARKRAALNPQRVSAVSSQLAQVIAQEVYALVLRQDDSVRESADVHTALLELATLAPVPGTALMIPLRPQEGTSNQPLDALEGLPEDAVAVLSSLNELADATAAVHLVRRNLAAIKPIADDAARGLGLVIDWAGEGGRDALREALGAYRKARADCSLRDSGALIPTPNPRPSETQSLIAKAHTLRDVLPHWHAVRQPADSSRRKVEFSVRLFEKSLGVNQTIQGLTKAQGTEFIGFLLMECGSDKTAKDHFDGVKALLNFACDQQDWLQVNVWKAHVVPVKKRRQRKPWPAEALVKLFDSPLFSSYELPTTTSAGADAAYWVPLLGLYTGARQSELCQLRIEDVAFDGQGLTLLILADAGDDEEDAPGTSTKGETTQRRVPVHSDLIRLGFDDYVKTLKKAGEVLLFPAVKRAPGRPAGEYFSDWFKVYRDAQGVGKRYQDFHAFRHTSRTRLTDAGVDSAISSALLGHTSGGTGQRVYDHSTAALRPALERLKYPELNLERCYRSP